MVDRSVTLAVITGAHGVTGEVRLKLFCEDADSLKAHKAFNGGALTLKSVRATPYGASARFAEIADRTAAEKMRGTELTVPRASLPSLADGEYYHTDLMGLACRTPDGSQIGICVAIENFGAGDILEIEKPDGGRFMVPMSAQAVPAWDDQAIVIDPAFVA